MKSTGVGWSYLSSLHVLHSHVSLAFLSLLAFFLLKAGLFNDAEAARENEDHGYDRDGDDGPGRH